MATSTVISGARTSHRAARTDLDAFQGTLALDWANGQAVSLSGTSAQSNVFDSKNDRIVFASVGGASTVVGCWISVGTNPTASAGAGSMWVSQDGPPVPIYVPAGMLVAGLQGASAGTLSLIPALIAATTGT